uniref:Uncharacterized protein n=1 Tax=Lactuca sativa TaxID=4236 RepID=A0A9R1XG05_LACSA|nr:hypothetical protein LSAT_V11C400194110 [Lactuca sativa]
MSSEKGILELRSGIGTYNGDTTQEPYGIGSLSPNKIFFELHCYDRAFFKGASWDPNGRMILIAFSESLTLGSVHFATKPPSLDAHLLPADLPELKSLTNMHNLCRLYFGEHNIEGMLKELLYLFRLGLEQWLQEMSLEEEEETRLQL